MASKSSLLAQLVERETVNLEANGSIPAMGASFSILFLLPLYGSFHTFLNTEILMHLMAYNLNV